MVRASILFLIVFLLSSLSNIARAQHPDRSSKRIELRTGPVVITPIPDANAPTRSSRRRSISSQPTAAAAPDGGRVIIGFERRLDQDQRAALTEKGIEILSYAGDTAYVAKVPTVDGGQLRDLIGASNRLTHMGSIESAEQKASPEVRESIEPKAQPRGARRRSMTSVHQSNRLVVRLWPDVDVTAAQESFATLGKIISVEANTRTIEIEVDSPGKEALLRDVRVRSIDPGGEQPSVQNDTVRSSIGAEKVWSAPYNLTGAGINIGVWDGWTIAGSHPSFRNRVTFRADSQIGTKVQRNYEHATHVAGTLAGTGEADEQPATAASGSILESYPELEGLLTDPELPPVPSTSGAIVPVSASINASNSGEAYAGIAKGAKLVSADFVGAADEILGLVRNDPTRIDVINNSWGFREKCADFSMYKHRADIFDGIVAGSVDGVRARRIPIVFAAGNERHRSTCYPGTMAPYANYRSVLPPGTAKNVITVGAVYSGSHRMTEFSGYGPTTDQSGAGRLKPEVVAPGCRISGSARGILSTIPERAIGRQCGTSMAAPVVSGAIALVMEKLVQVGWEKTKVFPSSYKALLVHGATQLSQTPGPDYRFGYGLVNLPRMIALIEEKALVQAQIVREGQAGVRTRLVRVAAGTKKLKVTLAWDDPASPELGGLLVNDLDLMLISPSGAKHRPWILSTKKGEEARPATRGEDHTNVLEQVEVSNPGTGEWTISVTASALGEGPQDFSLVVNIER